MTPEHRKRIVWWGKRVLTLLVFGVMIVALDRLIRAYSYDEIATALTNMSPPVVLGAIGVLAIQNGFSIVREWLAVGYAGRTELGVNRIALASVVSRSLSTLGFASITGVGLRLHVYAGWGVTAGEVAEIAVYDNSTFLVGLASQFGLTFTLFPIPRALADSLGAALVRAIGVLALVLVAAYVGWSKRGHELRIRTFVIPVPRSRELLGQICLPIIDLALTALMCQLCLPAGLGLGYFDVMIACQVASIASSVSQIPAGIGVLEGTMLLFVGKPEVAPAIIAGLFVYRIITNLLPIVVGAVLLVGMEVRRHATVVRPAFHGEVTATMLAALTFVVGAVVMIVSASPVGGRFGEIGRVLAIAAGSGMLFVARGLQRRSKVAWWVALGLLVIRVIVGFTIQPALYVIAVLVVVGGLLALSRSVFAETHHPVVASPRWWIAAAMVLSATLWTAFVTNDRQVTPTIVAEGGAMIGVAAIALASAVVGVLRRRRLALGSKPDASY